MKRFVVIGLAVVVAIGMGLAAVGQGKGQGNGNGGAQRSWVCPYGYTTPNPNAGGWWTRVTPSTPEQQAFLDEVIRLHNEIRTVQFELAGTTDPAQREVLLAKLDALRSDLHELQLNSRDLKQELMQTMPRGRNRGGFGMGAGRGQGGFGPGMGYGRGTGICPFGRAPIR
ncbi:MAG: hypothetical protein HRF45_00345 [Fimbriimonadia bacterium]|jgi:hypothetical protein